MGGKRELAVARGQKSCSRGRTTVNLLFFECLFQPRAANIRLHLFMLKPNIQTEEPNGDCQNDETVRRWNPERLEQAYERLPPAE